MKCMACKNDEMFDSTSTYFAELKNCIVIVKNVPCKKCNQCGEVLYSMEVAEQLEKIMSSAEALASELTIVDYRNNVA